MFGKVANLTDYGAFVEIEAGIEGLVHVSRNGLDQQERQPQQDCFSWVTKSKSWFWTSTKTSAASRSA